jgi:hypothetical protein
MLYFIHRDLSVRVIGCGYKLVWSQVCIVEQLLIELSKLLRSNNSFINILAFKHTPKTCGLILKHVWRLFGKLQTCLQTYFQILPISLYTFWVVPVILSSRLRHFPFGLPASLCKPWCKGFSPFVWVFGLRDFNFLHDPCTHCFLK